MAIKECPKCGNKVSDRWNTCPYCGEILNPDTELSEEEVKKIEDEVLAPVREYHSAMGILGSVILLVFGILFVIVGFNYPKNQEIMGNAMIIIGLIFTIIGIPVFIVSIMMYIKAKKQQK